MLNGLETVTAFKLGGLLVGKDSGGACFAANYNGSVLYEQQKIGTDSGRVWAQKLLQGNYFWRESGLENSFPVNHMQSLFSTHRMIFCYPFHPRVTAVAGKKTKQNKTVFLRKMHVIGYSQTRMRLRIT